MHTRRMLSERCLLTSLCSFLFSLVLCTGGRAMAAALICSIQLKTAYEIINSRTFDFGSAHTTRIKDRHITHRFHR